SNSAFASTLALISGGMTIGSSIGIPLTTARDNRGCHECRESPMDSGGNRRKTKCEEWKKNCGLSTIAVGALDTTKMDKQLLILEVCRPGGVESDSTCAVVSKRLLYLLVPILDCVVGRSGNTCKFDDSRLRCVPLAVFRQFLQGGADQEGGLTFHPP